MKDLAYDIEQLYIEGYGLYTIAVQLGCDVELVHQWMKQNNVVEEPQDDEFFEG